MKYNRIGDEKSLVARSVEKYWKIYERIWFISENKELNWGTSGEVDGK